MTFSIIVPVYNVEKYLRKCLESLLSQTFSDYEILIVDDGATDSSSKIADEIALKVPNKISVIHQENKGLGGARNTGIGHAKGEYLVFIDSDDFVSSELLTVAYRYIQTYDLDILEFNAYYIDERGKINGTLICQENEYEMITPKEFIIQEVTAWNKIYRKRLFLKNSIYYPEKMFYEDLATTPMLALYAEKIGKINKPLYYYLQRKNSIMRSSDIQKFLHITYCTDRIIDFYKNKNMRDEYFPELEFLVIQHVGVSTILRILTIKYDTAAITKVEEYIRTRFPNYQQNKYLNKMKGEPGDRRFFDVLNRRYRWVQIRYLGVLRIKKALRKMYDLSIEIIKSPKM